MNTTNGVIITIESTGESFHSLRDYGLAIGNTDYIGAVVKETNYVNIPSASIDLDLSEAATGHPVYKYRPIKINFGGTMKPSDWDSAISELRNRIDGQICHFTFDNDPTFYWRGRVSIDEFSHTRNLGTFSIVCEHADPYKYDVYSSMDDWEWDPFDFEYGVIRQIEQIEINTAEGIEPSIVFPRGNKEVTPTFIFSYPTETYETPTYVSINGVEHLLDEGENKFADYKVGGNEEVTATFRGYGFVDVNYRGGSL